MSPGDIRPFAHLGSLAFQILINLEKMLDFAARVGRHVGDGADLIEARVTLRNGQDLLVGGSLIIITRTPTGRTPSTIPG